MLHNDKLKKAKGRGQQFDKWNSELVELLTGRAEGFIYFAQDLRKNSQKP